MDVTWTIPLERLESTADVKCEFLVKQVEQLAASNKELSDSVKYLTQALGLPEKVQSPLFAAFNNTNFTLSADRKTLVKNAGTGNWWQGFVSELSLVAISNRFTLSFTTTHSNLMVGVVKRGTNPTNGFCSKTGSWMLHLCQGSIDHFYYNGSATAVSNRTSITNGSRLTVCLEPQTQQLVFELNGTLVHSAALSENPFNLLAAVDFYEAGHSVNFE